MAVDIAATFKRVSHLPPLALVGIIGGGIAIAYVIKKNNAVPASEKQSIPIDTVTADNVVALERQNVGGTVGAYSPDSDTIDAQNTLAKNYADLQANNASVTQQLLDSNKAQQDSAAYGAMFRKAFDDSQAALAGKANAPATTAPVANVPVVTINQPLLPSLPTQQKSGIIKYPGLSDNYLLNCNLAYKGLHGTYEQVYDNQAHKAKTYPKLTGSDIEFLARNMSQIAVSGFPKGESYGFDVMQTAPAQAYCNQLRVLNGLYPLTQDEFNRMVAQMLQLSGPRLGGDYTKTAAQGGSKQFHDVFHSGVYAKTLFNTWNYPYQCERVAAPRRDVGAGLAGY